jgi:hypothetical protein
VPEWGAAVFEYLPGPEHVVADHLSHNLGIPHTTVGAITVLPGNMAYAAVTQVLDWGGDDLGPYAWRSQALRDY